MRVYFTAWIFDWRITIISSLSLRLDLVEVLFFYRQGLLSQNLQLVARVYLLAKLDGTSTS